MITPEIFAAALASASRDEMTGVQSQVINARPPTGHNFHSVALVAMNGLLRWRHIWREHDRQLARIPGPLVEC